MSILINSFRDYLMVNNEFADSVNRNIQTEDNSINITFPCVYLYSASNNTLGDFSNNTWETNEVQFVITALANTPNVRQKLNSIEDKLYNFLNSNKNFPVDGYDRAQVFCLSRGTMDIYDYEGRAYIYINPKWSLTGWRLTIPHTGYLQEGNNSTPTYPSEI